MDVPATPAAAGPNPQPARLFATQDLQVVPTRTLRAPVFQERAENVIFATVSHECGDERQSCAACVASTRVTI